MQLLIIFKKKKKKKKGKKNPKKKRKKYVKIVPKQIEITTSRRPLMIMKLYRKSKEKNHVIVIKQRMSQPLQNVRE